MGQEKVRLGQPFPPPSPVVCPRRPPTLQWWPDFSSPLLGLTYSCKTQKNRARRKQEPGEEWHPLSPKTGEIIDLCYGTQLGYKRWGSNPLKLPQGLIAAPKSHPLLPPSLKKGHQLSVLHYLFLSKAETMAPVNNWPSPSHRGWRRGHRSRSSGQQQLVLRSSRF